VLQFARNENLDIPRMATQKQISGVGHGGFPTVPSR
jgi:hypothetical protein